MGSKYFKILLFSFICSLLIGNCHLGFAQKSTIDSLKTAYQNATHDTTKAKLLVELSEHIYLLNPDSVIPFCQRAIEIIEINLPNEQVDISHVSPEEESSFLLAKARALNNIGFIHQQQGDIKKGLEYYFESVKIYKKYLAENLDEETFLKKEKIFKKCLTDAYINIGFIYNNQGEIEKGLEYYYLSLKIKEEIKDKKGLAESYNNIGAIYHDQGEIDKALEFYYLSLKILEEIKDKKGLAGSYNNIGTVYHNQGEIEMALEYYFMSLKIKEEIKDKKGIANSYHNIGGVLGKLDSLDEGMKYLELGLELEKELGHKSWIAVCYSSIGGWQLKLGQVELALKSGLETLALAKEIGIVDYVKAAAGLLSDVYKKQSKFEDALAMYELEVQMQDSIVNEDNQKQLIRQEMKYEYEKEQIRKEHEAKEQLRIINEQLSRRDNLHYSAIFIGILILFGGILMLGFVKIKPNEVKGIIFISFLILFEFVLVLADPHIEQYTGGAPGYKLLFNAGIAGFMFPLHQFFERKLKKRISNAQRKKINKMMEQYKKDVEEL
ncbi:MAG: tetratricopeptide repeat protein [Bacteroidia bacterium]|nr:tetratricopeptide repeat protein [Bacteroidia bacterium]